MGARRGSGHVRFWLGAGFAVVVVLAAVGPAAAATGRLGGAGAAAVTPTISAPPDTIVGEADGTVDFGVRLSAPSASTVTVNYATANSTAAAGTICNASYIAASGTLTFAPGETSKLVPITFLECNAVQGFRSLTLNLSTAVNATIARASTRIGIVDDDTLVTTPRLFVRDATVDEKDGTAYVPVLLGGPAGQVSASTVTVDYATSDGTAHDGSDYTGQSGTLTFTPGQTVKTIAIPITDDAVAEPAEDFSVKLSNASNATIADGTGRVVIGASDSAPVASPGISASADMIVGEADGYVDVPVTLSAPSAGTVSVDYATAGSTAGGGTICNDSFVGVSGTLNFAPGETTKVVRVDLLQCAAALGFRSFTFGLSNAVNGTIARASARIGIVDDSTVVATPRLFVRGATVDEKDGLARVPVLLGGPTGQASAATVTVDYTTADGTATAGSDYTAVSGTLSFAPGQTVKTILVPITDDTAAEPAATFSVGLSNASNATIADGTGRVVIGASDGTPVASPGISASADMIVGEADGYVDVPVTLSAPSAGTVSVDYATAGSTAGGGTICNDSFVGVSGTLNFAPGETTKVVRVDLLQCAAALGFRSFTFGLSNAVNGTIARASARIGIVDDSTVVATPRLFVRGATVDEKDGTAYVSVLLGGPAGQVSASTVTVDYASSDGTATAGSDYTPVSGTLSFAPGQTVKTIAVPIADDVLAEPAETFSIGLSNPTNATIADGTARILIGASDAPAVAQPRISAPPDVVVGEGDGFLDLPVRLSAPATSTVSVDYSTAGSTAGGGTICNDSFVGVSGTLNFAPGETTKVVRVDLLECAAALGFRSFTFGLSNAVNGTIARASTRIGVVDNSTVVATPALYVRDAIVDEKDGFALVHVLLGGAIGQTSNSTVTVDYATVDGTAVAGSDYTAESGTLSFAPGQTVKTVVVPINDDALPEGDETFSVDLSNPTNATIADGSGRVLIGANDGAAVATPGIAVQRNTIVREVDGYVDLAVELSAPGTSPVSVNYATADGTAGAGTICNGDYVGASGTLSFAPGETTKVVRIDIDNCSVVEPLEFFTLNLSGAVNGTITRSSARVLIIDDSGSLSSLSVTPANPSIAAGTDQQFTATGTFSDAETFDLTTYVDWASAAPGAATISLDGLAHGVAQGASTISASLLGASDSTLLTVGAGPAAQSISFGALPGKTYGDADFTVNATATSGLPVSFAASGSCTVGGSTVHITAAGSCTITASQAGNGSWAAAAPVPQQFSIGKANQTITVTSGAPASAAASTSFAVAATAPGGAVTYSSAGACTNSGATFTTASSAGTCTVKYDQGGNANYNPAQEVTQSVTVTAAPVKLDQTITFLGLPDKTLGDPDFTVSASATSGLPVTFAASGQCSLTGTTVHLIGTAGTCTITATQGGNAIYNAASPVAQSFTIVPPPKTTCTVPNVTGKTLGAAKTAIANAHCRTGSVRKAYSARVKKGLVVSQSRAAGSSLPANTTINLVVSLGRAPTGASGLRPFVNGVESVLGRSASARRTLAAALAAGFSCSKSPRATVALINGVTATRQRLLLQARALHAPTPAAARALSLLEQALAASITADRYYAAYFTSIAGHAGCPLPRNANSRLAAKSDTRATALKQRFVAAFNPLARSAGRATWSASKI